MEMAGLRPWVAAKSKAGCLQSPLNPGFLDKEAPPWPKMNWGEQEESEGRKDSVQSNSTSFSSTAQSWGAHSLGFRKGRGERKVSKRTEHPGNPIPLSALLVKQAHLFV